jgi:hypothetical protein
MSETPNTKLQTPKKLQAAMSNDQIPRKRQFPSSNRASGGEEGLGLGTWDLFGAWAGHWALGIRKEDVEFRLTKDRRQLTTNDE